VLLWTIAVTAAIAALHSVCQLLSGGDQQKLSFDSFVAGANVAVIVAVALYAATFTAAAMFVTLCMQNNAAERTRAASADEVFNSQSLEYLMCDSADVGIQWHAIQHVSGAVFLVLMQSVCMP